MQSVGLNVSLTESSGIMFDQTLLGPCPKQVDLWDGQERH